MLRLCRVQLWRVPEPLALPILRSLKRSKPLSSCILSTLAGVHPDRWIVQVRERAPLPDHYKKSLVCGLDGQSLRVLAGAARDHDLSYPVLLKLTSLLC